jgi:superfamily II DNA or RNA helicase
MTQELWSHQVEAKAKVRDAYRRGSKSVLCVSPCGSGKGTMAADIARETIAAGRSVRITAHRRILVRQLAERAKLHGLRYTIEMADLPDEPWATVDDRADLVIASRDTSLARLRRGQELRSTDLHIVDEAHLFESAGYSTIQRAVRSRFLLGYTATPVRPDGSGLSNRTFHDLVEAATIQDLIANHRIVPVEVYAPVAAAKRRRKGLRIGVTGDPVLQWQTHAAGLRTATFCRTVAEARAVRDAFTAEGIDAAVVDQSTPDEEREAIFEQLRRREILVLCNVYVAEIGWDFPELECVQLLTQCSSPVAFWQRIGRGMRTYDDEQKQRLVLLDHAAAMAEHGWPNLSPQWSLTDREPLQKRQQERYGPDAPSEMRPVLCQGCGRASLGSALCPSCGTRLFAERRSTPAVSREPLELIEDAATFATGTTSTQKDWTSILYQAANWRGGVQPYAWAASVFHKKHHLWPEAAGVEPVAGFADRRRSIAELWPQYCRAKAVTS